MKVNVDTNMIWERIRYYNELSHQYSLFADELTKIAQEMENSNE